MFLTNLKLSYKVLVLSCVGLASCGGGGGSSSETTSIGTFVDSPVDGVHYTTETQTGLTSNGGQFHYQEGEQITFHIGDILLGQTMAQTVVTPVDLVPGAMDASHQGVTNMVRLMLTMDGDADPSNGIQITEQMRESAKDMNIEFDVPYAAFDSNPMMSALVAQMTNTSLVNVEAAQAHMNQTLQEMGMNKQ